MEKARLESFFDFCCFDSSFVELRRRTRHDLEVTGNAYWEVLRDGKGDIARFVYVPSYTVRLLPLDKEAVEVRERVRISAVSFDTVTTRRRLRRYIQVQGSERVYFKSFGDSRVISRLTGRAFPAVASLKVADASDGPATELIHFAIHSPRSPYGIPRWVGTLLSVLGSRQMEEVNYLYFNNKSVPPLALLVSGGRLSDASVPRIERFIEENLKGKANFHKILILEADGAGTGDGGRAKIELRPLTDAQQQDALFQAYDARNIDKVGSAFRLPPLLRGDGRDFNRSVAEAQLRFAEDQVFQPERDEFDFLLNRQVLGVRRLVGEGLGDNHLVRRVHRRLRVVGLLEACALLHDSAVGVREVALRLRRRLALSRVGHGVAGQVLGGRGRVVVIIPLALVCFGGGLGFGLQRLGLPRFRGQFR
ncbi:phage portal protein [Myxococcus sp. 1LA]